MHFKINVMNCSKHVQYEYYLNKLNYEESNFKDRMYDNI